MQRKPDQTSEITPVPVNAAHLPPEILGDGTAGGEMEALVEIMRRLRAPDGCPWDRKQTHRTLLPYLLEETYEVIERIENDDIEGLRGELGDLLLQIVFHGQIASEENRFTTADSIKAIREKLIARHPHVFGDVHVETADQVRDNWERIKLQGDGNGEKPKGTLSGVPAALPALTRAFRVQEKMAGVGFDWPDAAGALDKLDEEVREAREAVLSGDRDKAEEEIGDLLFSVVNAARLTGFGAEESLRRSTEKVIRRFNLMEKLIRDDRLDISRLSLAEMDRYWDAAKAIERENSSHP